MKDLSIYFKALAENYAMSNPIKIIKPAVKRKTEELNKNHKTEWKFSTKFN